MIFKFFSFFIRNIVLTIIIVATILHWIVLGYQLPVFTQLPRWFWHFKSNPIGNIWIIISLLITLASVITLILKIDGSYKTRVVLLIIFGLILQLFFGFLEGRGMDAIKDRITYTGHAEFADIAVRQRNNLFYVLKNYEPLLSSGRLGKYANSKPPGTLFFYIITEKIAEFISGNGESNTDKTVLDNLRNVASFLWPLISYLILMPLFVLSKMLVDDDSAILTCSLYLVVPSVTLITLHTDQVIYPLLAIIPVTLSVISAKKNNMLMGLFAGIFAYLSIWFSFGILVIFPFIFVLPYFIISGSSGYAQRHTSWKYLSFMRIVFFVVIGFFLTDINFRYIFDYDILLRYNNAVKYHLAWKHWTGTYHEIVYFGFLNLLEFTVWVGVPLITLMLLNFKCSIVSIYDERNVTLKSVFSIMLIFMLVFIAFAGRTKGEVARLWLFFVPFVCIAAAHYITKKIMFNRLWFISIILFLQFLTIYMIKKNQDFW